MKLQAFKHSLEEEGYADNSVLAYTYTVRDFLDRYETATPRNLSAYREYLIDKYKPKTVNQRVWALNKFLDRSGKPQMKLKAVRMAEASFLDNVIENEDYFCLKKMLRKEEDKRWYFIVWTLATTGARVSELVQFKAQHVREGHIDIYSKGGRIRRIFIPSKLRNEMLQWLDGTPDSSYLFLNANGKRITPRGIAIRLKEYAEKFGIDPSVVHPHAFRHLFAKNFLDRRNDLPLLADILGHVSISTTRIYLRRSTLEQQHLLDNIVDW